MFWKDICKQVQDKGMISVTLNIFQWLFLQQVFLRFRIAPAPSLQYIWNTLCWGTREKWEMLAWFEYPVLVLFCFGIHSCLTDSHSKTLSSLYKTFPNLLCLLSLFELKDFSELSWNTHYTIFPYKDFRIFCLSQPKMLWKQSFFV